VTTENIDNTSALDQDQAQLDAVQEDPGSQTAPSSMTDEIRALREQVENQNKTIENQNRQVAGLHSKLDTGLNSIRKDSEDTVRKQQEQQAYAYMQSLPEEHQAAFGQMLQANQAYYQQNTALKDQINGTQGGSPEVSSEWEEVYAIPRSLGIDPQTQGIDYAAFTEPGLSDTQRRDRFFASLKPLMGATNQAPATQAQQQPAPGQVQSPPTGGTPSNGASSNMRSIEQVQTAYIEGKLSKEEYTDQLNKLGQ
jgi:hypothetical protein